MSWPCRLVAVPTSALRVDVPSTGPSGKGYSVRDLQAIAATVPAVYDRLAQGWTAADFAAARSTPDRRDQQLGETYARLFDEGPSPRALVASYDGVDLVVDSGNHRVEAARSIDVPVLPVWVRAATPEQLDQVRDACARRLAREGHDAVREVHDSHVLRADPEWTVTGERGRPPEGRERDERGREVWR